MDLIVIINNVINEDFIFGSFSIVFLFVLVDMYMSFDNKIFKIKLWFLKN